MQKIGNELIADSGYRLTNGNGYWHSVYLGCNDDESEYVEVLESDIPQTLLMEEY